MSDGHIEKAWAGYVSMVYPHGMTSDQYQHLHQAFFAGATVLFTILQHGVSDGDDVTAADEALMESVNYELTAFGQALDAKYLDKTQH